MSADETFAGPSTSAAHDATGVACSEPLSIGRWLARSVSLVTATLFLLGLTLRITIRDRWPWLAPLFYMTPLPVMAGLALVTTVLQRRRTSLSRWRWWAIVDCSCRGLGAA